MLNTDREKSATRPHVRILANPTSGGYRQSTLNRLSDLLKANGFEPDVQVTRRAGEIGEICRDPALTTDILVVAGGDGSVNEAVSGFQSRKAPPPSLAVVPFGTANVLAHELGLPTSPERIADMIIRGNQQNLYSGAANGKPFVLMASAGFDAAVVHNVSTGLKRRVGKFAYVYSALQVAFQARWAGLEVDDGQSVHQCRLAVVTNASHYGGRFTLCPAADVTIPGLHVFMLQADDPLSLAWSGAHLLTGRIHKLKNATVVHADAVEITSSTPVPAQIDGDPFGSTPLSITSETNPLPLLVP